MIVTGILDVLAVTSVLDDCVGLVFVMAFAARVAQKLQTKGVRA